MTSRAKQPLPSDYPPYLEGKSETLDRDGASCPSPRDALLSGYLALEQNVTPKFPRGEAPGKAIRRKCIDCCCGQIAEVDSCPIQTCPLWPYRFGKNPFHGRAEGGE